jgi:hypothetical protein
MRILQKNMELRAGNREPKKTMELLIENAQLTDGPMKCMVSFGLNHGHWTIFEVTWWGFMLKETINM